MQHILPGIPAGSSLSNGTIPLLYYKWYPIGLALFGLAANNIMQDEDEFNYLYDHIIASRNPDNPFFVLDELANEQR
jgi:hypothetical protein